MIETICSRKSVRSYTGENITAAELDVILKAANAAPVGMGQFDSLHLTAPDGHHQQGTAGKD